MGNKIVLKKVLFFSSRIINALILGFILFFLFAHIIGGEEPKGEGFSDVGEMIMFICFPILTCVGLMIAWKWEFIGGLISFFSVIVLMLIQNHLFDEIQFWIIALPGMLHILHSRLKTTAS